MEPDSILCNVVLENGPRSARLSWDRDSGRILSVEETSEAVPGELVLFPGFVDIHVHAREYPFPAVEDEGARARWEAANRKETFTTAGEAAINGGVTLYCAMPNDAIPPTDAATYELKRKAAKSSACPVVVFAAIAEDSEPWADLPYKVYLDASPSPVNFDGWDNLEATLARYSGCRVFFHAEDPGILRKSQADGPRWQTRPPDAEIQAVRKVIELAAKIGLRAHICHISTEGAVRLVEEYNRTSDDKITCEVTPHHLFFSVVDGQVTARGREPVSEGMLLDCNPPLRSESDRRFLIDALREGIIHVLASDHAPHTMQDKINGAPGMPHLDTLGPFVGVLLKEWDFPATRVAEILSATPAALFASDLDLPQGKLERGHAASFTVLDMAGTTLVEGSQILGRGSLKTRCGWSPFSGIELPASVKSVTVRGSQGISNGT
jgi:dihydroorotase